jgi:starch synthase
MSANVPIDLRIGPKRDWQCALIPAYLEWSQRPLPTVFTIHNLAYQGVFSRDALPRLGIPAQSFHIDGVEFYDRLSLMKAGLVYASHLTTVSQTYAAEITTPEFGCGLEGILRKRAEKKELSGILNGIDESWDPRTCTSLTRTFDAGVWRRRSQNAREIRRQFGLAVSRGPLMASQPSGIFAASSLRRRASSISRSWLG